ncbi:phosphomethylpyrimidine synthase ThiC [bacterium]|nr:phosphomethylpyrimidine synthase ThiC [bacterium]
MTTRIEKAQLGITTDEMREIAKHEGVSVKLIKEMLAQGRIAIIKNISKKSLKPLAIGNGLKTKVCASIASNFNKTSFEEETDKLRVVQLAGADCILDLSYGSYIEETRHMLLSNAEVPVGSSPMLKIQYEMNQNGEELVFSKDDMFSIVKSHCLDGVDFICLNCSLTKDMITKFEKQKRLSKITSRAAQFLYDWIKKTGQENPFYEYFDELLAILKEKDITLFLDSAFKTGSTNDSFDATQISEYTTTATLAQRAIESGVQVVADGIGHIPINKIKPMVDLIKESTQNIPLFISSALTCDCAIGYDNITSSIASAICCANGANLLSATASVDYLEVSTAAHLREGVISAKIAANSGDLANNNTEAIKQNYKISYARANENWRNQIRNSIDKSVFEGVEVKNRNN